MVKINPTKKKKTQRNKEIRHDFFFEQTKKLNLWCYTINIFLLRLDFFFSHQRKKVEELYKKTEVLLPCFDYPQIEESEWAMAGPSTVFFCRLFGGGSHHECE